MAIWIRDDRRLIRLLAAFSAALLGGALAGQYGLRWYPCELCLYQRYPYAAIILLGVASFYVREAATLRAMLWLCVALLAVDAGIAVYHTGVEAGLWPGPSGCASDSTGGKTLEQMRAEILGAPLVSCSQAMAYVLGLSLAAWNALLASAACIYAILCLRKTS